MTRAGPPAGYRPLFEVGLAAPLLDDLLDGLRLQCGEHGLVYPPERALGGARDLLHVRLLAGTLIVVQVLRQLL